ncbi:hypothetical protein [Agrobacterium pusense]|jgi:hypothetical protein|uniref:hypothetical protein n=1 Tax=Agrobacterium pusense TaxID=648995 RepID=UPI0018E4E358|nr:hypothetical protein [Agrobacterium pusense]
MTSPINSAPNVEPMAIIHALKIASHAPSLVFTTYLPFLSLIDARQYETSSSLRVKGAFCATEISASV